MAHCQLPSLLVEWSKGEIKINVVGYRYGDVGQQSKTSVANALTETNNDFFSYQGR